MYLRVLDAHIISTRMALLKPFFEALGERLTHENRISDVLYAALCSSEAVFTIVGKHLKFPKDDRPQIEREYVAGHGRPDFKFTFTRQNAVHLVEVKLYDRDYHYEEYCKIREQDGQAPSISLITAHTPDPSLAAWNVVRWDTLIGEMEKSDDAFVQDLGGFFRKAIMIEKPVRVDFTNPKALLYLNRATKTIINDYRSAAFKAVVNLSSKSFDEDRSGYEYSLRSINDSLDYAWARFQFVYQDHLEGLWIWFTKRGNAKYYDRMKDALRSHYSAALIEDRARDACYVMMQQDTYTAFRSCGTVDEQLELLRTFFMKVNRIIEGAVVDPSNARSNPQAP